MKNKQPPFQITNKIIDDVAEISELTGRLSAHDHLSSNPNLRRTNRIRTIHGSLAIEQNTLSLEQVTAVLNGKHVLAPPKDIAEVKNAYEIYERLDELDPYSVDDLLTAHGIMTRGLVEESGMFRTRPVGVVDQKGHVLHFGTLPQYVPDLVVELLDWAKHSDLHMLIRSCVFQDAILDYYLANHPEIQVVDNYQDDGRTGTDSDREDFQRLLADIYAKKINCVIVKDLSRLSRNDYECGHYLEYVFVSLDVRFISVELPALDSYLRPEEISSIATKMQSYMNDQHCYQTSIKIRSVLDMKRSMGQFIGAFAPYGYLKDPEDYHKLVINPETAPIVQDIFQWYVYEGMNKNAIARKLIALGIPSPTAYKQQMGMNYHNPHAQTGKVYWSERTIVNMLKNPTYLGHMVQGRHQVKSYKVHTIVPIPEDDWFWVENTHEAIIDQQTFDRAQELLEKNVRTSPKAKTVYLFSGFLRCGDCGRGMTRRTSKGYTYYSCKTYIMKSRGLCSSHTIRDELVEQVVFEAVKRQIDLCGSLAEIIDEISQAPVVRNQSTRLDKLLKTQEQELHKITNLCDNLYIDWKSGDLTRDEYHRMKAKFEQQAEEIRQTIANLQEEQTFVSNGITSADPYLQTFLKYKNIDHLERGIVVALIKQISIYEEKRIEVEFNFADQHQRILDFIEANQPKLRVVKSEAV